MTPEDYRDIRLAYRLTPHQLARVLGVHPQTIYAWENPNVANVPPPYARVLLLRLAEATRDPDRFHETNRAINSALRMDAAPTPGEPLRRTRDGQFVKGLAVGFGLGVLLTALFREHRAEKPRTKTGRRTGR